MQNWLIESENWEETGIMDLNVNVDVSQVSLYDSQTPPDSQSIEISSRKKKPKEKDIEI